MKKYLLPFIMISFFLSACSDLDEAKNELPFKEISFTQLCGWCANGQLIQIKKNGDIKYVKTFPCDPDSNIEIERTLTAEEIDNIKETFNMDDFLAIDLDQCGECYDGCDDTLILKGLDDENHSIRYDRLDEYQELNTIMDFIETLNTIRSTF